MAQVYPIHIRNLSYNGILKEINITLESPKLIGIIGPNGSGKTTLLRHIYRDIKTKAQVFLNREDIAHFSIKALARELSVLTQFNDQVEGKLTVEEIIIMGRMPYKRYYANYQASDFAIAERYMARFGLENMRHKTYETLSGGEKQRVMLAKCFTQETDLFILDEPTNHLDVRYQVEAMKALAESPATSVVTIHDINLASKYCDYLILMKEGEIYQQGAPETVLTKEHLYAVFGVHFNVVPMEEHIAIFL